MVFASAKKPRLHAPSNVQELVRKLFRNSDDLGVEPVCLTHLKADPPSDFTVKCVLKVPHVSGAQSCEIEMAGQMALNNYLAAHQAEAFSESDLGGCTATTSLRRRLRSPISSLRSVSEVVLSWRSHGVWAQSGRMGSSSTASTH